MAGPEWFAVQRLQDSVYLMGEPMHVNSYLILGSRRATVPTAATRLLGDGDRLALGDRDPTVVHTPGHSPDNICLLDVGRRLLFCADTVDTGPAYPF
jgi:glyoxylase-like metal-dependent hydrolase (beta-lactamase superfamily II)